MTFRMDLMKIQMSEKDDKKKEIIYRKTYITLKK
jgi:translation initiation factor IF-1